ncbi:MAG: hypothetical protein FWE95_10915 [Planctomycetaceae bacterium]|nr:hypothetical protein [Planctomycetaceae bacterium]
MQMTIDVGYDQVYQLARQLPPRERRRLAKKIAPRKRKPAPADDEPRQDLIVLERRNGLVVYQVPFPDTEEGRIRQEEQKELQREFRENHPEFFGQPKCSREEWQQILLSAPTLTPGDAQEFEESMKNFRKDFNNAFERRRLGLVDID